MHSVIIKRKIINQPPKLSTSIPINESIITILLILCRLQVVQISKFIIPFILPLTPFQVLPIILFLILLLIVISEILIIVVRTVTFIVGPFARYDTLTLVVGIALVVLLLRVVVVRLVLSVRVRF